MKNINQNQPAIPDCLEVIVEKSIRLTIETSTKRKLPSLQALARHHRVSVALIRSIINRLKKEDLVEVAPGRGITIKREFESAVSDNIKCHENATDELVSNLTERIRSGIYKYGEDMPKIAFIARNERTSDRTVVAAYQRLAREGLIHKRGKGFTVGNRSFTNMLSRSTHRQKTILVIEINQPEVHYAFADNKSSPFIQAFMHEASIHNVKVLIAFIEPVENPHDSMIFPSGKAGIESMITSEKENLVGVLSQANTWTIRQLWNDQNMEWISWLCSFEKPVVWLDYYNSFELSAGFFTTPFQSEQVKKNLTRCYPDESGIAALIISRMRALGHQLIGIPTTRRSSIFSKNFRSIMLKAAEIHSIQLLFQEECRPLFHFTGASTIKDISGMIAALKFNFLEPLLAVLAEQKDQTLPFIKFPTALKSYIQLSRILGGFITTPGLTALCAANDMLAVQYYHWLLNCHIAVPDTISLISINDNLEKLYPYPISSVNFGMDNLGYKAFHTLVGDIPIKKTKDHSIPSISRINHEGTIAAVQRL